MTREMGAIVGKELPPGDGKREVYLIGARTMKTTSRRICGALIGLGVLSAIVPGVGADDAADWANQQAQAQKERDEWYRQQAQAQREYEQAERDRQARDDWYKQQAQAQKDREQAERDQKERDEWDKYQWQVHRDYQQSILNRTYDDHPWARAGWTAGAEWKDGGWVLPQSATTPPKAPVARPMPAPQVRLPVVSQRRPMPLNPFAFQQMVRQHQAQVRQQIMQSRQQMLPGRQAAPQLIVNPFAASSGRQELDQQFIQNPFVGSSP